MELDTQPWLGQDLGYLDYCNELKDALESVLVKLNGLIRSNQAGAKSA